MQEPKKYRRFFHTVVSKGEDKNGHLEEFLDSDEGHCIPLFIFLALRKKRLGEEEIWMKHSRKLFAKEQTKYPFIHNMKEYIEYLFTIMPDDTVKKIKEDRKKCKNIQEAFKLFPEVYQPLLELRDSYDKHGCKYHNTGQSLVNKVIDKMPLIDKTESYNKEAFNE